MKKSTVLFKKIIYFLFKFRSAFKRSQTFLWFCIVAIGFCVRQDKAGVTSFIRCFGLSSNNYYSLLNFFHTDSVLLSKLTKIWTQTAIENFNPVIVNGHLVILIDGTKEPKEGRKMPAVRTLHQESESNSKPEFIMGHSIQQLSLLVTNDYGYVVAVPLAARIHEGIADSKTLFDKANALACELGIKNNYYLIGDAYYCNGKIIVETLKNCNQVISRVKKNAVAYMPVQAVTDNKKNNVGRRKKYGKKIILKDEFLDKTTFKTKTLNLYGKDQVVKFKTIDLIWRKAQENVRFVFVCYDNRDVIFLSTDLSLSAEQIIELYSLRFKIEVGFKSTKKTIGVFSYHFWLQDLDKIKIGDKDLDLEGMSEKKVKKIKNKIQAYEIFIQVGLISTGIMQNLSLYYTNQVWGSFNTWLRTIRDGIMPSEAVVKVALQNMLPQFLYGNSNSVNDEKLKQFIVSKQDSNYSTNLKKYFTG